MNEQEINQKLEQAEKDKASIEANIVELQKQKTALEEKKLKWVAATARFLTANDRLVLNLSALSEQAKKFANSPYQKS